MVFTVLNLYYHVRLTYVNLQSRKYKDMVGKSMVKRYYSDSLLRGTF